MTNKQHIEAWNKIRAKLIVAARKDEWRRDWYAQINAPRCHVTSRRRSKGNGKGVGAILEHSFVKSQVSMERVFVNHNGRV